MTYCVGIWTRHGLVMASDSRTNAGHDQVNVARKMHVFAQPGERVFILLSSGSLSCTQSIITLLRRDFDQGKGLAQAPSLYDAARVVGEQVRRVSDTDRGALERDDFKFNVNLILGGQVRGEIPGLFIIYPQGNPLQASEDSPYLQIGETKYGRPILDRGIRFERTTLEEASKYALLSLDSTMRSNVTVGPPIDLLAYGVDELEITRQRRFPAGDPDLVKIGLRWEQALRQAVARLPQIRFRARKAGGQLQSPQEETIQLVEPPNAPDVGGGTSVPGSSASPGLSRAPSRARRTAGPGPRGHRTGNALCCRRRAAGSGARATEVVMFFELRQYHIRPGQRDNWVKCMEEEIIPFQVKMGMVILGSFVGEEDESVYVWIRRFESEAERKRLYDAVYQSDYWKNEISPRVPTMIDREQIKVTRLVATPHSVIQ